MKHGTLVLPVDRARHFINLIGACTNMQFEDMNARDMHRPYRKYIQRIDEMERILRFLTDELAKIPGATLTEAKNAALEEKHVTALATQSLKTIMSGPGTDV